MLTIFLEGTTGPMSSVLLSTIVRAAGGRLSGTTCPEGFLL